MLEAWWGSTSQLAWHSGQERAAIDTLTSGDLIVSAMEKLTELHELLVIVGERPTADEYAAIKHITALGDGTPGVPPIS